jgi:hypothetical protein
MRIALLMLATLLLAAPAHAQSRGDDKVFDSLFGTEPARTSGNRAAQAERDDLTIVALYLGRFQLLESLPAYAVPAGLCLPLVPVLDALEVGHEDAGDRNVITLHAPERRITVDPADLTPSPEGPCLALPAFARLLPVTVQHDPANLRISIDSLEPLPITARLERAERRRQALSGAEPPLPHFPQIANPWGVIGFPTIDLALAGVSSNQGNFVAGQAELVGDLARMTARARLALESNGPASMRLSLGRDGEDADLLGPLHARSFAVGDINAPAQPLIGVASSGRGIVVSNRPLGRADLFDQIELRGPLPRGWDAELHRDDRLVAVFETADASGDYVFRDVPLRAGANNYVVRLFGPHGEIEERTFSRFVGSELNPENEFFYAAGIIDSGVPLLGPPAPTQTALGRYAFATLEKGLAGTVSMRLDVRTPLDGSNVALAAGVHAAVFGGFGSLLVAGDGGGRPAVALRGVRQWGRTNMKFDVADYGNLVGPMRAGAANDLAREFGISAETRIGLGRHSLPLLIGVRRAVERSGNVIYRADTSLALALGPWRFSQDASLERRGAAAPNLHGNIAAARTLGSWRLRAGADYGGAGGFRLNQIGLSAARATARGSFGFDFGWDAARGAASIAATVQRHLGAVSLGAGAGIGPNGWRVGINVSAALFHDAGAGYRLTAAGIGSSGALRPHVFEDMDGNGLQGAGEPDIVGARFLVDNSLRHEATAADGRSSIGALMPNRRIDMEVQLASLPDLRLRPAQPGIAAVIRPGQVLEVPVPMRQTGEIEALVETINGDLHRPLPGIEVALVDTSGKRFAMTRSDFEGLAYFDGVPQGNWRLESAHAAPVPVTLRHDALLATGLRLLIGQ